MTLKPCSATAELSSDKSGEFNISLDTFSVLKLKCKNEYLKKLLFYY